MKCCICDKTIPKREAVEACQVVWCMSSDGIELATDYWKGNAHSKCVEWYNKNGSKPHYYIIERKP